MFFFIIIIEDLAADLETYNYQTKTVNPINVMWVTFIVNSLVYIMCLTGSSYCLGGICSKVIILFLLIVKMPRKLLTHLLSQISVTFPWGSIVKGSFNVAPPYHTGKSTHTHTDMHFFAPADGNACPKKFPIGISKHSTHVLK